MKGSAGKLVFARHAGTFASIKDTTFLVDSDQTGASSKALLQMNQEEIAFQEDDSYTHVMRGSVGHT